MAFRPPRRRRIRQRDHSVTGRFGQRTITVAAVAPAGDGVRCGRVRSVQPEFLSSSRQIPKTWQKRYSRSPVPPAARNSPCAAPTRSAPSSRARSAAAWSRSNHLRAGSRPNPARLRLSRPTPRRFRRQAIHRVHRVAVCRPAVRRFGNRRPPIRRPLGPADRKRLPGPLPAVLERPARPIGGPIGPSHLHRCLNRQHRLPHHRLLHPLHHLLVRLPHRLGRSRVEKGDGLEKRRPCLRPPVRWSRPIKRRLRTA